MSLVDVGVQRVPGTHSVQGVVLVQGVPGTLSGTLSAAPAPRGLESAGHPFGAAFLYPVVRSCTERMNQRNVDVLRTSMSFVLDPATLRVPTRTTIG